MHAIHARLSAVQAFHAVQATLGGQRGPKTPFPHVLASECTHQVVPTMRSWHRTFREWSHLVTLLNTSTFRGYNPATLHLPCHQLATLAAVGLFQPTCQHLGDTQPSQVVLVVTWHAECNVYMLLMHD